MKKRQQEDIKIVLLRQQAELGKYVHNVSKKFLQSIREEWQQPPQLSVGYSHTADAALECEIPTTDNRSVTRAVEQLRRINNALNRLELEDAGFGQCEECGEKIPFDRIKLIPTTTLCTTCKESREANAAMKDKTFRVFRRPLSRSFLKNVAFQ